MFIRVKETPTGRYLYLVVTNRQGKQVRQQSIASLGRIDELTQEEHLYTFVSQLIAHVPQLRTRVAREGLRSLTAQLITTCPELAQALRQNDPQSEECLWNQPAFLNHFLINVWEESGLKSCLQNLPDSGDFLLLETAAFASVVQRLFGLETNQDAEKQGQQRSPEWLESLQSDAPPRALGSLGRNQSLVEEVLALVPVPKEEKSPWMVATTVTTALTLPISLAEGAGSNLQPSRVFRAWLAMTPQGIPIKWLPWDEGMDQDAAKSRAFDLLCQRFQTCDWLTVSTTSGSHQPGAKYFITTVPDVPSWEGEAAGKLSLSTPAHHICQVDGPYLMLDDQEHGRYVAFIDPDKALDDKRDRQAILDEVQAHIVAKTIKQHKDETRYRPYLMVRGRQVEIDKEAVRKEAECDGLCIVHTNADMPVKQVVRLYQLSLWQQRLWQGFGQIPIPLEPNAGSLQVADHVVRGHLVAGLLAAHLGAIFRRELADRGILTPWSELVKQLRSSLSGEVMMNPFSLAVRRKINDRVRALLKKTELQHPSQS